MSDATERQLVHYTNAIWDSSRWEGFELRPDDLIISTPPKCGTTWTQMIVALLIFQTPELPASLATLSPWLDMRTRGRRDVVADLEGQTHRRFIKTHTPLPGLPFADQVTYICVGRDPRDVFLSMGDHVANVDFPAFQAACSTAAERDGLPAPEPPAPPPADLEQSDQARFWQWVLDDTPSTTAANSTLLSTLAHVQSFWDVRTIENVVMLHYYDLKTDLEGQMRSLADRLGIHVPQDRWPVLVQAASFDDMRRRASMTAPSTDTHNWLDDASFFKKGRSGAWRELLSSDDDLRRYYQRVAVLTSPDLSAWIHRS